MSSCPNVGTDPENALNLGGLSTGEHAVFSLLPPNLEATTNLTQGDVGTAPENARTRERARIRGTGGSGVFVSRRRGQ
jgi:hypothetical protein